MSKLLDANVILRYLLNDIPVQADTAAEAIEAGAFTIPEVIAEVVYVLSGVYRISRNETKNALCTLLGEISIQDKPVINQALELYSSSNLDYVDCVLIAHSKLLGEDILSFDKALNKMLKPSSAGHISEYVMEDGEILHF